MKYKGVVDMNKKGIDIKTVSETLGHANVNITLNRYVHTSFDFKSAACSLVNFLFPFLEPLSLPNSPSVP